MDNERIIEICLDSDFADQWNETEGKAFRNAILNLLEVRLENSISRSQRGG